MAYRLSAPYYKLKKIPYYSAIVGFMVLFVLMALKWPLIYDDYRNSMGKMESIIPFSFVLIGGFIYYLINERHKRLG
jgi:amino acid permease